MRPEGDAAARLRGYQRDALNAAISHWRDGRGRVCITMPTGAGKTILGSALIERYVEADRQILVIAHRRELLTQFYESLTLIPRTRAAFIAAGQPEQQWQLVQIASVQTLARRLDKLRIDPKLIIVDEAHHAKAKSYLKVLSRWPQARVLGLTATPARLDGKPLADIFDRLVVGPGVAELIASDHLAAYDMYSAAGVDGKGVRRRMGDFDAAALDKIAQGKAIANVVGAANRHLRGRRVLAFSVSRRASKDLTRRLREDGFTAEHIDGQTDAAVRRHTLREFGAGRIDVLCSVDLIGEGFDCPECDAILMARPTHSETIYLQQVGRAMRPKADGRKALLIDCAGNVGRHGLPCGDRDWTLEGAGGDGGDAAPASERARICKTCGMVSAPAAVRCGNCGAEFPKQPRHKPEVDVALGKVDTPKLEVVMIQGATRGGRDIMHKVLRRPDGKWHRASVERAAYEAARNGGQGAVRDLAEYLGYKPGWADKFYERARGV